MARGELVSDAILLGMLEDRFSRPDTARRLHPRRLSAQPRPGRRAGHAAGRMRQPFDFAVQLEVPTEMLVERIAGRAAAEGRADDSPESVRKRLQVYDEPDRAGDRFLPPARPAHRGRRRGLAGRGVHPDPRGDRAGAGSRLSVAWKTAHPRHRRHLHGRRRRAGARTRPRSRRQRPGGLSADVDPARAARHRAAPGLHARQHLRRLRRDRGRQRACRAAMPRSSRCSTTACSTPRARNGCANRCCPAATRSRSPAPTARPRRPRS